MSKGFFCLFFLLTTTRRLDIDPSGSRFATGGSDNKIKVWNAAPLRDEQLEASKDCPKLLALLENHTKAVNCVRFAPAGLCLASGGDDRLVFVWQKIEADGGGPQRVFGASDDTVVHERWHVRLTLRAHAGDVVDLAWSPTAELLVSCSLSQELFVWNVAGSQRDAVAPLARLAGHEGMIKGVAWDPIGRYVASACDDCTVRVWRVADWGQEAAIAAPFADSSCSTYYRRLSWSPDGQMLTCAGATSDKMSVAAVIERGTWASSRELVGHRQAVVVASWNPALYQSGDTAAAAADDAATATAAGADAPAAKKKRVKKRVEYGLCAIGSLDSGLSIWTTHKQRSIMVAANVHNQSIVDLAWDRNTGDMLGCASVDGTVSFYLFNEKDLGTRLPASLLQSRLAELYGDAASAAPINVLPEDPELITAADTSMAPPPQQHLQLPPPVRAHPSPGVPRVVSEQTVTIVGGKRRINPATLADGPTFTSLPAAVLAPLPPSTASNSSFAQALATAPLVKSSAAAVASTATPAAVTQKRKRIEPRDVDDTTPAPTAAAAAASASQAPPQQQQPASQQPQAAAFWLHSPAPPLRVVRQVSVAGESPLLLEAEVTLPSASAALVSSSVQCVQGTQLQWSARLPHRVTHLAGTASWAAVGCEDGTLLLRSSKGRLLVPALVLDAPLVALEASARDFLLAITADGSVAVWRVGALTRTVTASVRSLFASGASRAPLQPPQQQQQQQQQLQHIAGASIADDGVPIVTLPSYESFVFHASMQAWMRVVDRRHLRSEHSSVLPLSADEQAPLGAPTITVGTAVAQLREDAKRSANVSAELIAAGRALLTQRTVFNNAVDEQMSSSIEHLEHRLATALLLGPASEQLRWVRNYARNAANAGLTDRLRELLATLLGRPPAQHAADVDASTSAAPQPLAMLDQSAASAAHRREMWQLAREALAVIRTVRQLQRLYTEFSEQLRLYEQQQDQQHHI